MTQKHPQGEPIARGPTPEQIFDMENDVEPERTLAERIFYRYRQVPNSMLDDIACAIKDAREIGAKRVAVGFEARIADLEAQLQAEGEHTAADQVFEGFDENRPIKPGIETS